MNPFKPAGFDNLIGVGMIINATECKLPAGSTLVVDGSVTTNEVTMIAEAPASGLLDKLKPARDAMKTTLIVNGDLSAIDKIVVNNVTVTGHVKAKLLVCEGMLAIKAGAKVEADEIRYRSLTIEDGAVVLGTMGHLDHVSQGEQV